MSTGSDDLRRVWVPLREDPDAFDALRDLTADTLGIDPGAIEKDYWATEVRRAARDGLAGWTMAQRTATGSVAHVAGRWRHGPCRHR